VCGRGELVHSTPEQPREAAARHMVRRAAHWHVQSRALSVRSVCAPLVCAGPCPRPASTSALLTGRPLLQTGKLSSSFVLAHFSLPTPHSSLFSRTGRCSFWAPRRHERPAGKLFPLAWLAARLQRRPSVASPFFQPQSRLTFGEGAPGQQWTGGRRANNAARRA